MRIVNGAARIGLRAACVAASAVAALSGAQSHAAVCMGAKALAVPALCADSELAGIERMMRGRFDQLVRASDPLTGLLLKRDQRWFAEILNFYDVEARLEKFDGSDDPERQRMKDALVRRAAILDRLDVGRAGATTAGEWENAFASVRIVTASSEKLGVEISYKVSYQDRDDPVACGLTATVERTPDGWFSGQAEIAEADSGDDADNQDTAPATKAPNKGGLLRLRLQGHTLRVVSDGSAGCRGPSLFTGSYFAMRGAPAAARTEVSVVAPSFDCAKAGQPDEEEICADPDLALADAELARAYSGTLRRLDARLGAQLREDQRNWVRENAAAFGSHLKPPWDKKDYMVHHTDSTREEIATRLLERTDMLVNLDEGRQGLQGLWLAHDAILWIRAADGAEGGAMEADFHKWNSDNYKESCDFKVQGRGEGNNLVAGEHAQAWAPRIMRDGATLTINDLTRSQPEYCTRMRSANARLFPVKAGPSSPWRKDRIR